MPAFEIVVVGCGGGHDETNLSGYLVKPYNTNWEDGIIALEAGSGFGALGHLLRRNPHLFGEVPPDRNDSSSAKKTISPFTVYASVKCFLLTHAHLDHISSLVMSAGSIGGVRKRIFAAQQTLKDLETVFSGRVWPRLANYDEDDSCSPLLYHALSAENEYETIFPDVAVRTMSISHGRNESGEYESSCFFIKHMPTRHEFVFFGDVEPDSIALEPRNIDVWRAAASKIPHDLSTIFIECSYRTGRPTGALFGHLSPEHLAQEMVNLALEVVRARTGTKKGKAARPRKKQKDIASLDVIRGALEGLRVYIMHCKETFSSDRSINHIIGDQCRELLEPYQLGVEVLTVDQGMKIVI